MQVKAIMSTEVTVVGRNDPLSKVEELMMAKKLRHVPVVEDGKLLAIITQRDLFKAAMSSALGYGKKAHKAFLQTVPAKEIMVEPVITVAPETTVTEATELMLQREIGCLPVIDGVNVVGIVTKTDLLRHLRDTGL